MVVRKYKVEDKEVEVEISIYEDVPPQLVFLIRGDPDTLKKYIQGDTLGFAVTIDDVFDAIREALSKEKVIRD